MIRHCYVPDAFGLGIVMPTVKNTLVDQSFWIIIGQSLLPLLYLNYFRWSNYNYLVTLWKLINCNSLLKGNDTVQIQFN